MFDRIDRVMLPVRDVAHAANWYVDTFRCRIVSQSPDEALLTVGMGETLLALERDASGRSIQHLHLTGHVPGFNFYSHWEHLHRAWCTLQGIETTEIMSNSYMNVNEFYDIDGNVVGLCHEKESSLYHTPIDEDIPPMIHRVLAVFLPVLDLEASIRWYTGVLGFELINHWGQGADLKVGSGETIVTMIVMDEEIHRKAIGMTSKSPYFSLQTSDIRQAYETLYHNQAVTDKHQSVSNIFKVVSPEGLVMLVREGQLVPV